MKILGTIQNELDAVNKKYVDGIIEVNNNRLTSIESQVGNINNDISTLENATYKNKGYYASLAELRSAFPEGSVGSRAYVGSAYPYSIYLWQNGTWVDSGATGGEEELELGNYYNKTEVDAQLTELSAEIGTHFGTKLLYGGAAYTDFPCRLYPGTTIVSMGVSTAVYLKTKDGKTFNVYNVPYTIEEEIVAFQVGTESEGEITLEGDIDELENKVSDIENKVSDIENNVADIENNVAGLSGKIGEFSGVYIGDVDIFTKEDVPSGNIINITMKMRTSAGAIDVKDSSGNILKTFAVGNASVGEERTFDSYILPSNYERVVNNKGYSSNHGIEAHIEVSGVSNYELKKELDSKADKYSVEELQSGIPYIKLVQNESWDKLSGKPNAASGYTRTEKLVYNKDARLLCQNKGYIVFFWNGDLYQGHASNTIISPYTDTTHIAFYWTSQVDNVIYSSLLNIDDKAEIDEKLKDLSFVYNGKNIDSSTGEYVDNASVVSTLKVPVKKGDSVTTSLPMYTIGKFDRTTAFLGQNVDIRGNKEYIVEDNVAYVIIVFLATNKDSTIYINGKELSLIYIINSCQNGTIEVEQNDDSILEISLNGKVATVADRVAFIPTATPTQAGLLSPTDKIKLDQYVGSNITINGSGVTKNASAYGFLPSNDGVTNAANLQNCLNGGGTIIIDLAGVYDISRTLLVDSNTEIIIGADIFFRKTKDENGIFPRHIMRNRGALNKTYNENIKIKGLNVITNSLGIGNDVAEVMGLRGEISMFYVKRLHIDGFTCLDGISQNFNIHVCTFEDLLIENCHIEGVKDGIHLGKGRNFTIRHCKFATDDDAIAINAHDYPESNAEIGDIEDGLIEDITYLKPPPNYGNARGALMLVGSWSEWKSGNKYIPHGDTVVSNGRIYMTYGEYSQTEITSTIQPTHTEGVVTYSDGLTWVMKQNVGISYSATIRRVTFNNIYCYRDSGVLFPFFLESSNFVRCYYPNSVPPIIEDVTINNVHIAEGIDVRYLVIIRCPFTNLIINNSNFGTLGGILFDKGQAGDSSALVPVGDYECNLLTNGVKCKSASFAYIQPNSGWNVRAKIYGTLHKSSISPIINGQGMTLLQSDL